MIQYTKPQLQRILALHLEWIGNPRSGQRADLRGVNLENTDLQGVNLEAAYLQRSCLKRANLKGANLRDAQLARANLRGASLKGANLQGCNLQGTLLKNTVFEGANIWACQGNGQELKSIGEVDGYSVTYTSQYLQIGCENHTIEDWQSFSDRRILEMDGKEALRWWRANKEWLFMFIEDSPAKTIHKKKKRIW